MRRLLISISVILGLLFAAAGHAGANAGASAVTDHGGISHGASNGSGEPSQPTSGGGSSPCIYVPIAISPNITVWYEDGESIPVDGTGQWYEKRCEGNVFGGVFYLRAAVDPAVLLADASRYLAVPLPMPRLSPETDQVVNLPTWLWIDAASWTQRSSTVSVPGVSVTVTATPEAVVWSFGDGTVVTCAGPGTAYNPAKPTAGQTPTCSHTFTRSSASRPGHAFEATVTVRWRASWTVAGAAGGGDLGVIDRSTTFPIRVGEVQAINTAAR